MGLGKLSSKLARGEFGEAWFWLIEVQGGVSSLSGLASDLLHRLPYELWLTYAGTTRAFPQNIRDIQEEGQRSYRPPRSELPKIIRKLSFLPMLPMILFR